MSEPAPKPEEFSSTISRLTKGIPAAKPKTKDQLITELQALLKAHCFPSISYNKLNGYKLEKISEILQEYKTTIESTEHIRSIVAELQKVAGDSTDLADKKIGELLAMRLDLEETIRDKKKSAALAAEAKVSEAKAAAAAKAEAAHDVRAPVTLMDVLSESDGDDADSESPPEASPVLARSLSKKPAVAAAAIEKSVQAPAEPKKARGRPAAAKASPTPLDLILRDVEAAVRRAYKKHLGEAKPAATSNGHSSE